MRTLPSQLDHLFAMNEVRVYMTLAARSRSDVRLASFRPSWELMRERHSGVVGLVPDALVELEVEGQGVRAVALEVDMSTESPAYLARRKLGRYRALLGAGVPVYGHADVAVFVVARGERRLRALASALADAGVREGVVLGDLDALDERSVLDLAL
ncbi:MAG: replication-relaxation family protein [Deltaproteobacteria bacterium]|nr:replication-relaxation family protein [Deltaproteobacteria bacterium]